MDILAAGTCSTSASPMWLLCQNSFLNFIFTGGFFSFFLSLVVIKWKKNIILKYAPILAKVEWVFLNGTTWIVFPGPALLAVRRRTVGRAVQPVQEVPRGFNLEGTRPKTVTHRLIILLAGLETTGILVMVRAIDFFSYYYIIIIFSWQASRYNVIF